MLLLDQNWSRLSIPSESAKLIPAQLHLANLTLAFDSQKLRNDIAKVEADLKSLSRRGGPGSDSEEESTKKKVKKPKRAGPSLLQLEREKYLKSSNATKATVDEKGKAVKREEPDLLDALAGFRTRVQGAVKVAKDNVSDIPEEVGIPGEIAAKEGFFSVAGDVDEDVSFYLFAFDTGLTVFVTICAG